MNNSNNEDVKIQHDILNNVKSLTYTTTLSMKQIEQLLVYYGMKILLMLSNKYLTKRQKNFIKILKNMFFDYIDRITSKTNMEFNEMSSLIKRSIIINFIMINLQI